MESDQSLNLIHSQKSRFFVPLVVNAIILCIVGVVVSTVVVSTKCLLSKASLKDNLASLPTSLPLPPHLPSQMPAIDFSLSTPMDTPSALLMPKKYLLLQNQHHYQLLHPPICLLGNHCPNPCPVNLQWYHCCPIPLHFHPFDHPWHCLLCCHL